MMWILLEDQQPYALSIVHVGFVGISASPFDVRKCMSEATQHMHLCIALWTSLNFDPGTL